MTPPVFAGILSSGEKISVLGRLNFSNSSTNVANLPTIESDFMMHIGIVIKFTALDAFGRRIDQNQEIKSENIFLNSSTQDDDHV